MKKKIIIAGITGLVGKALSKACLDAGYDVVGLARKPDLHPGFDRLGIRLIQWNGLDAGSWYKELKEAYAVINLAGENIAKGRWTIQRKERLLKSRLNAIASIQDAFSRVDVPPVMFIQASAIGYYGRKTPDPVSESAPSGTGFLAEVCKTIEELALQTIGVKVIITRFGVVLDAHDGALAKIRTPMRLFGVGAAPEPASNYLSWIHLHDLSRAVLHLLHESDSRFVYNITSPNPIPFRQFSRLVIGFHRIWIRIPVPWFILEVVFGKEMTRETLRADQRVLPDALSEEGFRWLYPEVESALHQLLT